MTKFLIVYTMLFSSFSLAYTSDQISLSDYEFRRYVRPQLRSISQDYQTLLFSLNPQLKSFKNSYNLVKRLFVLRNDLTSECEENFINEKCYEVIEEMNKNLISLIDDKIDTYSFEIPNKDERLLIQLNYEIYQNKVLALYTTIQNLIFQKSIIELLIFDKIKVINLINEVYSDFNLLLLNVSKKEVRPEFIAYWNGFIRPVTEYIIIDNRMSYFKRNITKLNVNWNLLNVKLTKRNIPISKQVKTLLNIMHNRWNNILKVSLNTKG